MASSISVEFVTHCENFRKQIDTLSCPDDELPWRCPCLQVMDIQIYAGGGGSPPPPAGSALQGASSYDRSTRRYYVLLHDTKKMLWGVAPPSSPLESMIANGVVEIGSLVTLSEYAIVEAANGRRVVVVLAATCSVAMPFSLIGRPAHDSNLFHLSANSLIAKQLEMERAEREMERQRRQRSQGRSDGGDGVMNTQLLLQQQQQQMIATAKLNKVLLADLWEDHASLTTFGAINTWHVYVRVLWRSKLRRVAGGGGAGESASQHPNAAGGGANTQGGGSGGGKLIFDVIMCDELGDTVKAVFIGKKAHEAVQAGQCYRIGGGSVHLQSRVVGGGNPYHNGQKRLRSVHGDAGEDDDEDLMPSELVPVFVQFHERTWIEEVPATESDEGVVGPAGSNSEASAEARLREEVTRVGKDDPASNAIFDDFSPVANDRPRREGDNVAGLEVTTARPHDDAADRESPSTRRTNNTADGGGGSSSSRKKRGEQLPKIPARAARLLSGAEDDYLEVRSVLFGSSIGDLVSFKGVVSRCGPITEVHTRSGRVDKLSMTVKDRAGNESIDVTLWGSVAQSIAPFLPMRLGTTWCFRDVTVRMYGTSKTISSRSSSEVQLMSSLSHIISATSAAIGLSSAAALRAGASRRKHEISLTFAGNSTQFGNTTRRSAVAENIDIMNTNNSARAEDDPRQAATLEPPLRHSSSTTLMTAANDVRGSNGTTTSAANNTTTSNHSSMTGGATPTASYPQAHGTPSYPFRVSLPISMVSAGASVAAGSTDSWSQDGLPFLLKIQHVVKPFVVPSCRHCGKRIHGPADDNSTPNEHMYTHPVRCGACNKSSVNGAEPRFMIRLELSDGISCVEATAYGEAASSLCGEELPSFIENCRVYGEAEYTGDLVTNLMGLPVLVSLTRIGGGSSASMLTASANAPSSSSLLSSPLAGGGSQSFTYHVTVLQHVDLAACAHVMSDMLDRAGLLA